MTENLMMWLKVIQSDSKPYGRTLESYWRRLSGAENVNKSPDSSPLVSYVLSLYKRMK